MDLSKDIYEYLTNFADDRTILNMLSVNKKFHNDEFFHRVMLRKYPHLIEFKKDETWKNLYIRMVYTIYLLEENYDIPYMPIKKYNPITFYNNNFIITYDKNRIYNNAMMIAAKNGLLDIVKQMVAKGAGEFKAGMREAALGGHLDVVKYFIQQYDIDIDLRAISSAMSSAGLGGHLDIVKYLADSGATDFGALLFAAAEGKHKEIMKYAAEKGVALYEYDIAIDGEYDPHISDYLKELKKVYGKNE